MSPFSAPVLGAATVLASSALWQALVDGTLSLEVALTRFLVAAGAAWIALSALGALVGDPVAVSVGARPDTPEDVLGSADLGGAFDPGRVPGPSGTPPG